MYGEVDERMKATIRNVVSGKTVWAVGYGDLDEVFMLAECGARTIVAVDKEFQRVEPKIRHCLLKPPGMSEVNVIFADARLADAMALHPAENGVVVFLKWPPTNHIPALGALMALSSRIIYIGKNDGCTACGHHSMWSDLLHMEVEKSRAWTANDIIVYKNKPTIRSGLPIEGSPVCFA